MSAKISLDLKEIPEGHSVCTENSIEEVAVPEQL
jgi:hypothetical protein